MKSAPVASKTDGASTPLSLAERRREHDEIKEFGRCLFVARRALSLSSYYKHEHIVRVATAIYLRRGQGR